ncbi:hypothetical protein KBK19_12360 [Microvirga sp. STR05]|uniref:Uncharacterized protein n=1 Tax=Hymenobacter duratus TaxID=2771356 RepID=A0ABR8JM16_9BACT|nr:hypothetical protein [Hymenobacter duratus]MBD2715829.1 hypothetical protein [Hymenobacter duratus]MBR7950740.1 hypothetical protein [Microvirga sp. STR05]
MPVLLPLDASDQDIIEAVHTWVKLLEKEYYEEAFQFTYQDPYYEWTPDLMREVIYGYGFPESDAEIEVYKVTSMQDASTDDVASPYAEVSYHMPRKHRIENVLTVAEVWFSLPLNGKWSDVTATFNVLYMPSAVSLELQEIHVF